MRSGGTDAQNWGERKLGAEIKTLANGVAWAPRVHHAIRADNIFAVASEEEHAKVMMKELATELAA